MEKKDIAKSVVLANCIAAELLYLSFMALALFLFSSDPEPPMPISAMIVMTIHPIVLMGISINGFIRIKNKRRWILVPNFLIKLLISWFAFGFLIITMEPEIGSGVYSVAEIIFFIGCVVGGLAILIKFYSNKTKSAPKDIKTESWRHHFECDKAKWAWDSAAREYCKLTNKPFEYLSENETCKFYNYASSPIVYFLTWLIKNDFMSEDFKQDYSVYLINDIKNERVNPIEFFGAEMAYVLDSSHLSKEILPFMDMYYNNFDCNTVSYLCYIKKYHFDYYEVIKNYDGIFYCADFSWEKYHRIEYKINERYKYYLKSLEEHTEKIRGTARWNLFNTNLQIEAQEGVSDKYIESCIGQLNCLSDYVIDNLCDKLIDYCYEEIPDIRTDKRRILYHLHPQVLIINTPQKNEPAFIVGCEWDFDQEHGLAWSMRNDIILDIAGYADIESPWDDYNEIVYAIKNSIRYINLYDINSNQKVMEEIEKGNLKPLYLAHTGFNYEESKNNMVFVPPIVADLKYKYDIMIEYLFFQEMADNYYCYPKYKGNSLVPSELIIGAKKGNKFICAETIHIW